MLDELAELTGLHRYSVVRLLKGPSLERQPRRQQRGREYGAAVDDALRVIWESLDYVCAERLTPALVPTAEQLARHGELAVSEEVLEQLGRISVSSVQRRLTRLGQDTMRLPRRGPDRANKVAKAIPMRRIPWDTTEPGHFEVDLVHHSGPSIRRRVRAHLPDDRRGDRLERAGGDPGSGPASDGGRHPADLGAAALPGQGAASRQRPRVPEQPPDPDLGRGDHRPHPHALAAVPEERQSVRRAEERHPGPGLSRPGPPRQNPRPPRRFGAAPSCPGHAA